MPFEGNVGGNYPNVPESFEKRWLKRWRKFVEGDVDAQRDRDVLMDSGQSTRCPPRWHRMQDSNLRQPVLETGALPNRHMRLKNFVQFSQFSSRCFGGTIEAESSDIQEEPHGRKEH